MDIRQLRYFVTVARLKHFTRAAEELRLAQPALSQQVRQLELSLGVRLFDRTSRRVRLTDAGIALLTDAERVLHDVDRMQREMAAFADLLRGQVVIGTLQTLAESVLPALLAQFQHQYPHVKVQLHEDTTEALLIEVASGNVDLAFVHVGGSEAQPDKMVPSLPQKGIVTAVMYSEDLVLVGSPQHPFAQRTSVTFNEVLSVPLIVFSPGSSIRYLLNVTSATSQVSPRIVFEVHGTHTARALAAAGLGATILPRSAIHNNDPRVVAIPITQPRLSRTVLVAWRKERDLSRAAEAFLAIVHEQYPSVTYGRKK
jgi:LysR family transcriptional activator of glutamate synthase operon